jgi:polyphosphate glucokinase
MNTKILGIDVGGSGIKGSIVDTATGQLLEERYRIETPQPATPEKIAYAIKQIKEHFNYKGRIGCGFPSVIHNGKILTAANIDKSNIGVDAFNYFTKIVGSKVILLNDADAAGIAEISYGYGKNHTGVVLVLTIGTGIGSSLFIDGKLVPNIELGHMYMKEGIIAEKYTSDAVRKQEKLKWKQWAQRLNVFLNYVNNITNPELIIIGGGTSKKLDKFIEFIDLKDKIKPALLLNNAGLIGAAVYAGYS